MKVQSLRRYAAVLALPLALAACSGGGTDPASSGSSSASSAAGLGDIQVGQQVDRATFFTLTKDAAEKNRTYRFTTQLGQSGAVITSTGTADNGDAGNRKRQMTLTTADGTKTEIVIADGQVYQKTGTATKWTKAPLAKEVEQALAGAAQRIDSDAGSVTAITYKGPEKVGEVQTRHFTLTVDPTATASPTGSATATPTSSASAPSAPATASGAASSPASATTIHYWLDDQYRPVKMLHIVGTIPATTMYDKWGEPVTITVPGADEVTDATGAPTTKAS